MLTQTNLVSSLWSAGSATLKMCGKPENIRKICFWDHFWQSKYFNTSFTVISLWSWFYEATGFQLTQCTQRGTFSAVREQWLTPVFFQDLWLQIPGKTQGGHCVINQLVSTTQNRFCFASCHLWRCIMQYINGECISHKQYELHGWFWQDQWKYLSPCYQDVVTSISVHQSSRVGSADFSTMYFTLSK